MADNLNDDSKDAIEDLTAEELERIFSILTDYNRQLSTNSNLLYFDRIPREFIEFALSYFKKSKSVIEEICKTDEYGQPYASLLEFIDEDTIPVEVSGSSCPHLLGLPSSRHLIQEALAIDYKICNLGDVLYWFSDEETMARVIENDAENEDHRRFNWYKMGAKAFGFFLFFRDILKDDAAIKLYTLKEKSTQKADNQQSEASQGEEQIDNKDTADDNKSSEVIEDEKEKKRKEPEPLLLVREVKYSYKGTKGVLLIEMVVQPEKMIVSPKNRPEVEKEVIVYVPLTIRIEKKKVAKKEQDLRGQARDTQEGDQWITAPIKENGRIVDKHFRYKGIIEVNKVYKGLKLRKSDEEKEDNKGHK